MDAKKIVDYYDNFVEEQMSSGINDRIFGLYKRLKQLGLNARSTVLELGCGVGTMTYLLAKTVTRGQIEAVDISPKSIAFCTQKIRKQNVHFLAGDVVSFSPSISQIDFITLFDVIEHIPVEMHLELFQHLSKISDEHTRIVVNIPNPDYIQYDIDHHPDHLQVIDQPVPLSTIVENLVKSNLELVYFETYTVWVKDDYQFLIIRKKTAFEEKFIHKSRSFFQKAIKKVERTFIKIKYNYP